MNRSAHRPPALPRHGFGLIETVVGAAILTAVLLGLAQVGQLTSRLVSASNLRLRAAFLAEEGIEAVRILRDSGWSANIGPKTPCTDYYLSSSGGSWQISTNPAPLVDGIFDRRVRFEAVSRDAADDITGTGCAEAGTDPGSRKVTVSVLWPGRGQAIPPLSTGLVGYWDFDVNAGGATAYDLSGNGNHGTLTNMDPATDWVEGKIGTALEFDGSNDYVALQNLASIGLTGSMTISAWVKPNSLTADDNAIISKRVASSDRGWTLKHTTGNRFQIEIANSSTVTGSRASANTFGLGQFYHVVGVYDAPAGTLDIYVNGVRNNGTQSNCNPCPSSQYNSTGAPSIGRQPANNSYFDGLIDEVRIYNRALSADEIRALYLLTTRLTISTYFTNLFNN